MAKKEDLTFLCESQQELLKTVRELAASKEEVKESEKVSIHEILPHRASFAGSVNHKEFLTDISGNRRFLCFEAESIKYNIEISLNMVYAQAVYLYKHEFRYWFDGDENQLLNDSNEEFRRKSIEEEILVKYLEPCKENEENAIFGNATAILRELIIFENKLKLDDRTVNKLGRVLSNNNFKRIKRNNIYGYIYKIKSR